ncbi:Nuf2 family-domain-containing protein [Armillaria luteobubalina]|uniref:Nuf2 family-domain-containing protein n=1 Tax=Armillaria luteobubalina TaxID=153913 RepID=A0AA39QHC2_9AGAR|nr:Nuf2 family-domain-containing protein [Armillaria luteobubalina]
MAPRTKNQGIFPLMDVAEIIESLSAWGFTISIEQINHPSVDLVETIAYACLAEVTGISRETLEEAVQESLAAYEDKDRDKSKDLYTETLTNNILLTHMARFAAAAKLDDFTSSDIYRPTRERTIRLLSAFINFVKFTEQDSNSFAKAIRERSDGILLERDTIAEQLSLVKRKTATIQAKMAEDEPRCEQLRIENFELTGRLRASKEIQIIGLKEWEKLKAEKVALLKRREALNDELESMSESVNRTRSRVVQSPERIKRTISTMSTSANEDKKIVAMHENKAKELQAKFNALHNIERASYSLDREFRYLHEITGLEKEERLLQESHKELGGLRDDLEGKKIELSELRLKRERVEKQLSNAHEKLERAQRHAEEKKLASQRTIDRLQKEINDMAVERRDNDKQVEQLRVEAEEVERKMAEHLRASQLEINELLGEYWKLRHHTDVYRETLANIIGVRS